MMGQGKKIPGDMEYQFLYITVHLEFGPSNHLDVFRAQPVLLFAL